MSTTGRRGTVSIHRSWLNHPDLSDGALRFMLWLDSHTDDYLANVNYQSAAEHLGWSRNRVKRLAAELESFGLVSTCQLRRPGGGTVTKFTLHLSAWTEPAGPSQTTAMVHREASAMVHREAPTNSTLQLVEEAQSAATDVADIDSKANKFWDRYPSVGSRKRNKAKVIAEFKRLCRQGHEQRIRDAYTHWLRVWQDPQAKAFAPEPLNWLKKGYWDMDLEQVAAQVKSDFGSSRLHVPSDVAQWIAEGAL